MDKLAKDALKVIRRRTKAIYSTCIDHELTKCYLIDLLDGLLEKDISYLLNNKKEGNPVPSLLEENKNLIIRCLRYAREAINVTKDEINNINRVLVTLENGVETNKEQPKFDSAGHILCHTCGKRRGTWRPANIENSDEGYYSCTPCFEAVWAGEK